MHSCRIVPPLYQLDLFYERCFHRSNVIVNVPISASFTPRSAPISPRPRKGNMTPGVSYEYTNGSSESFSRVDKARVIPGSDDVRRALDVAMHVY